MPGELTAEQWDDIKKGLNQIIVINTSLENTNALLEKTNNKIDNLENTQNKMVTQFALLSKTVQGNGVKKGSVLDRLDCLEKEKKDDEEEKKEEEQAQKKVVAQRRKENKQLIVAVLIAILGSTALNTVIGSMLSQNQKPQTVQAQSGPINMP